MKNDAGFAVEERKLDPEGRVLLPKAWRKKYGRAVLIVQIGKEVRVLPKEHKPLSKMKELRVPLKAKLTNWHAVKAELSEE